MLKAKYWIPLILGLSLILGVLCNLASGVTVLRGKYGVAFAFPVTVWDSNSPWAIQETPAWEAGDAKTVRNGDTTYTNVGTLTVDKGATSWQVMSIAEMTAKIVTVVYQDQTAPPVWMDDVYVIQTFGDANAYEAFDTSSATPTVDIQAVDGNAPAAANMLVVYGSTNFLLDYNSTTKTWNVNVQTVKNEAPEADVVDTLLDVNDNLEVEIAAVQSTADTIDGKADTIQAVTDALPDAGALTTLSALIADANDFIEAIVDAILADTEAMDTASELRLLLNASGGEVANEPNQTLIYTRIGAPVGASISADIVAIPEKVQEDPNAFSLSVTPSETATEGTIEWILAWIHSWVKRLR